MFFHFNICSVFVVVLSFALKKLKAAEEAAKKILVTVKQSTSLSKAERREQRQAARAGLKEIRARQRFERRRQRLERRASALSGQPPSAENIEAAANRVTDDIEPIEDLYGSAEFRSHLTRVWTKRALERAVQMAGS